MKNVKIKWGNALFNAVMAILVALMVGFNPLMAVGISVGVGVVLGFSKPLFNGVAGMAIQREIWENDIVSNLYKNNQFLQNAYNADQYVLQGKVVHIPNAGAAADVVKDRTTLPATVKQRTDKDISYTLSEFTSDPILIPNADTVELSYDKRQSVTGEAQQKLREEVAEHMLRNWAPDSDHFIKTTGDDVSATAPSATGNRKKITLADLKSAMTKMNKGNVSQEDRFALLSAEMYDQLIDELTATQYRDFSQSFDEARGILGKLYSFNVMMRSTCLVYDSSDNVLAVGADGSTDDNEAALVWQKNSVERALGDVKFFENIGDPTYYGDIYSFLLRMGGRIRRNDAKGVNAIVQAASA